MVYVDKITLIWENEYFSIDEHPYSEDHSRRLPCAIRNGQFLIKIKPCEKWWKFRADKFFFWKVIYKCNRCETKMMSCTDKGTLSVIHQNYLRKLLFHFCILMRRQVQSYFSRTHTYNFSAIFYVHTRSSSQQIIKAYL